MPGPVNTAPAPPPPLDYTRPVQFDTSNSGSVATRTLLIRAETTILVGAELKTQLSEVQKVNKDTAELNDILTILNAMKALLPSDFNQKKAPDKLTEPAKQKYIDLQAQLKPYCTKSPYTPAELDAKLQAVDYTYLDASTQREYGERAYSSTDSYSLNQWLQSKLEPIRQAIRNETVTVRTISTSYSADLSKEIAKYDAEIEKLGSNSQLHMLRMNQLNQKSTESMQEVSSTMNKETKTSQTLAAALK